MIRIREKLQLYSLTSENSIVIGSGILNALRIRESSDIDLIVHKETYERLEKLPEFTVAKSFGLDLLKSDIFEIGTAWNMVDTDTTYYFEDLMVSSVVIENVRYISLELLLDIKKIWVNGHNPREKDQKDIILIEQYMELNS